MLKIQLFFVNGNWFSANCKLQIEINYINLKRNKLILKRGKGAGGGPER